MAFAEGTTVTVENTQSQIAALVVKYGADGYRYGWDNGKAAVMFRSHDRMVRFVVTYPDKGERRFHVGPTGRSVQNPDAKYDQEIKRRWRALLLCIKAKLEAVETGITDFEAEFLAHIVLPGGGTVYEHMQDRLALAYESGDPVDLVPALPTRRAIEGGRS